MTESLLACAASNATDFFGNDTSLERLASQCHAEVSTTMTSVADTTAKLFNFSARLWNVSSTLNETSPASNTTDAGGTSPFPAWWQDFFAVITVAVPVFYGLTCLCGLVGNLLVILVITQYSNMKTLPNVYILNLAIADFLFMLTIPFLAYQFTTHKWIFGSPLCKFVLSFDGMNQFTGVFLLTAMSLDRYLAFIHPIKSLRFRILRNTRAVCILMWAMSTLVCLPLWIYSETFQHEYTGEIGCTLTWPRSVYRAFVAYAFAVGYALPLLVISVCYFSILRLVLTNKQPGERGGVKKSSRRVAILIITAVIIFATCWLPFYATQLYYTFFAEPGEISFAGTVAHYVGICLSYGNSAINPLIYTFVGRNFKENVIRLFLCRGGKRRRSMYASSTHQTNVSQRLARSERQNSRYYTSGSESASNTADVAAYDNRAFQQPQENSLAKPSEPNHRLGLPGAKGSDQQSDESMKFTRKYPEETDTAAPQVFPGDTDGGVPLREFSANPAEC